MGLPMPIEKNFEARSILKKDLNKPLKSIKNCILLKSMIDFSIFAFMIFILFDRAQ